MMPFSWLLLPAVASFRAIAHGQGPAFSAHPARVITQSSGKQRIIDNADAGGQSALSSGSDPNSPNRLVLCSPLRPAQHAAAMLDCLDEAGLAEARGDDAVEGGGEDWPDAYRYCPMDRAASFPFSCIRDCSSACPSRSQASTAIAIAGLWRLWAGACLLS